MEDEKKQLTPKQQVFVNEYLIDLNATQAAIRAGYSPDTAQEQSSRLLSNVMVQSAIFVVKSQREERTQITQDMVVKELAKIAFSEPDNFVRVIEDTVCVGYQQGVDGHPDESQPIYKFEKRVEVTPTELIPKDQRAVISEVRQTKDGIVIKFHDKVKSLELLGKHLGMFVDRTKLEAEHGTQFEVHFGISRPKRDNPSPNVFYHTDDDDQNM